ncbi:MAG TPA: glycerol-3-phosphate dehydrogenase/oxidase [Gemmatimonadaceae bacterium]
MPAPTTPPVAARRAALDALTREPFDVLVVGGGITGAGVARDAAMRGLRTALVEKDDFASGTSSRSSRLVHGGVRYLEHGDLRLVFEASHERRVLRRLAPHLVRPLAFTWPVYAGARIARWKLAAGLTLYDLLATFRNVARHERLSAAEVLRREPHLLPRELRGGARYWDALTDDARLTLATVRSAVASGATVVNHARVTALVHEGSRVAGAQVLDELDGGQVLVRARVVVNATGPWSDDTQRLAGNSTAPAVHGSKGVHVMVARQRVGNEAALTLLTPQDGRVFFVLPAGDHAIIGTTDTFEPVSPDEVRASSRDVAYLIEAANHFFPSAQLTRDDVITAWAGLRPLVASDASAADPGAVSREHAVTERVPGLVRITGGKLTTYRVMARDGVDAVQRSLGARVTRSPTADTPLAGGGLADPLKAMGTATTLIGDAGIARRLVHAHGDQWREVWAMAEAEPAMRERIEPSRPYVMAELRWAVEEELGFTLADLLVRRVPIAFETRDHGRAAARRVAPLVAGWLGWDAERIEAELERYDAEVERLFGIEAG